MSKAVPTFDETLCTLCGLCVEACSCHAVELGGRGPIFACPAVDSCLEVETRDCDCLCEEVCPTGAISCPFEVVLEAETSRAASSSGQAGADQGTDPTSTRAQATGAGGGRKE
jgi:formate hydrogenlyase subunit 6/NADH:ubiquinone oxidoreductase subunit I